MKLIERSLALFSDLASGYCSAKLLLKLEIVHHMLRHHTADRFPFLEVLRRHRGLAEEAISRALLVSYATVRVEPDS